MEGVSFPISIQQAADTLGVPGDAARHIVTGAQIPTQPCRYNGKAKMLDRDGFERLRELSRGFQPAMAG